MAPLWKFALREGGRKEVIDGTAGEKKSKGIKVSADGSSLYDLCVCNELCAVDGMDLFYI